MSPFILKLVGVTSCVSVSWKMLHVQFYGARAKDVFHARAILLFTAVNYLSFFVCLFLCVNYLSSVLLITSVDSAHRLNACATQK